MFKDSFFKSSYKPKSFLEGFSNKKDDKKKFSFTLPDYVKPTNTAGTSTPDKTEADSLAPPTGSQIKSRLKSVLSKKYGGLDTKNLFDDIDDKEVENNISTAESAIKANIDKGFLNTDYFKKFPNLRDGLALSYAAADKGNSKEAKKAREAAYFEQDEPLVKETGKRLLYNNLPKKTFADAENATKKESELPEASLFSNRSKENVPENGVRFKAEMDEANNQDKSTPKFEDVKSYAPKNSITAELQKNNHQFNNVTDEQKKIYDLSKKEGITAEHARIKTYAEQWKDVPKYEWTADKATYYVLTKDKEYVHDEKLAFINNYKDVIKDAAKKYNLPEILLAGIAYKEFGGDPMFADDVVHFGRKFYEPLPDFVKNKVPDFINEYLDKDKRLTSFGNTSVQIRRAAETLGYSEYDDEDITSILKDPIQNIYTAAAHLNYLRNIDYKDKSATELSDDEIKIIASRYNIGPQYKKDAITTKYGEEIYANEKDILKALK